ncbi:hypothetical protein LIA77_07268 [Sarocladium implicatum]|nr:hypothetical protein LIA77_07268 [Sarocladium implicatum]
MSAIEANTQKLIDSRSILYGRAFENRSADEIAIWHSKDLNFNDVAMNEYSMDKPATHSFFTKNTAVMRDLTILDQATYGETPEFVAWEMVLTVTMDHDEPALGIKAGQTSTIRGVALQWWRWEGEGKAWTGDLSSSEKGILGWKIVKETDYMIPLTGDSVQTKLRA